MWRSCAPNVCPLLPPPLPPPPPIGTPPFPTWCNRPSGEKVVVLLSYLRAMLYPSTGSLLLQLFVPQQRTLFVLQAAPAGVVLCTKRGAKDGD